jgi:hypothetical protein
MLSFVFLLATLLESPKPALPSPLHVTCPATPAAFTVLPGSRTCPALEVSGHIDAAGVALDPAFDVDVPPSQLAPQGRGDAFLAGYAADGRTLFVQSLSATGPFHVYVPLSRALGQSVQRLRLVSGSAAAEIVATTHHEAVAETLSLDPAHYLISWDAHEFPSVRVTAQNADPLLLTGTSTMEQHTLDSTARTVVVEFSDGVRSSVRTIRIFGR